MVIVKNVRHFQIFKEIMPVQYNNVMYSKNIGIMHQNCAPVSEMAFPVCIFSSGAALHAQRCTSSRCCPRPDGHAYAKWHCSDGDSSSSSRLPAHRRPHHCLLLLAHRNNRHHQSRAGNWAQTELWCSDASRAEIWISSWISFLFHAGCSHKWTTKN